MAFTQEDLYELPVSFCSKKGETWVIVGPCSAAPLKKRKIPLDGRQYKCAGHLILKNGTKLRASFSITTVNFDFIIMNSVYIPVNGSWYKWNEPELPAALGIKGSDFVPFMWKTDKPLDYHVKAPYPIAERLLKKNNIQ